MGWLRRYLDKPRGPLCECPIDGERFYARGGFDLRHHEDRDGVACEGVGRIVEEARA